MKERLKMTVTMEVTPAQAIALEAMFDEWNKLGVWGASRQVSFFADGDGNFRPDAKVTYDADPYTEFPKHSPEDLRRKARISPDEAEPIAFDFDPVAWCQHD